VYVWGVPIPSRFSWVPTLALTHLCVPEASFPAHMAGVVAGLLRAYCWEPGEGSVWGFRLAGLFRACRWELGEGQQPPLPDSMSQ
jgi:hypothetical protein